MDSRAFSYAVAKFSAKFCNELDKNKSMISSPLSTEFVLALLALGSTGDVRTELLTVLGVSDDDSVRTTFESVLSKLKYTEGIEMHLANKVYINNGEYDLNPSLKKDALTFFDAEIEKINFSNPLEATSVINKWIADKTKERIKNVFSPNYINAVTRLILVNAIYFKGKWAIPFNRSLTKGRPFHYDDYKTGDVPMMYNQKHYMYGTSQALKAKLLRISYRGDQASLIIVLPDEINGLHQLLIRLAAGHYNIMRDIERMVSTELIVIIPKFNIESDIDLTQLLPKLGVNEMFNNKNTGLSQLLSTGEPLHVAAAVQKAFIEVNEEGTEAAAVTGFKMPLCKTPSPPEFRADRPFLYILTVQDNIPAFIGTYRGS